MPIEIPSPDDDRTLRVVRLDNMKIAPWARTYILHTWDTYKRGDYGRSILGYAFGLEGETPLFVGADFTSPAGYAIDSDATLRSLMGFLTLRPGDTDSDYFAEYTEAQLAFCADDAEYMAEYGMEVCARDESLPNFVDVIER